MEPNAPERIASLQAARSRGIHRSDNCNEARPETHQNLIHTFQRTRASHRGANGAARPVSAGPAAPNHFIFSVTYSDHTRTHLGGGDRTRTDDPLLAKQVLSQLSYTP